MPLATCPNCDHEQSVPRELVGLKHTCEKCREDFKVEDNRVPSKGEPLIEPINWLGIFKSIKLIVGLAAIVGLLLAIVLFVLQYKKNADKERETQKTVVTSKQVEEAKKREAEEKTRSVEANAVAAMSIGVVLLIILVFTLYSFLLVTMGAWVAKDAYARGLSGLGWASFYYLFHFFSRVLIIGLSLVPAILIAGFGFFVLPVAEIVSWMGLFAYLYARRPGKLSRCRTCENRRLNYLSICPHCGK